MDGSSWVSDFEIHFLLICHLNLLIFVGLHAPSHCWALHFRKSLLPEVANSLSSACMYLCLNLCVAVYQVLIGEPGDLVLQTGFNPGLWRQLKVLSQQLLLPVVFLFHVLQFTTQGLHLIVICSPLSLQLVLQQPEQERWGRKRKISTIKWEPEMQWDSHCGQKGKSCGFHRVRCCRRETACYADATRVHPLWTISLISFWGLCATPFNYFSH